MAQDTERGLWGNGTLTIAARLTSTLGVPILIWLGMQLWGDVRQLRDDKVDIARALSGITTQLAEHGRWNAQQDQRLERLWDAQRTFRQPAPAPPP